jgi:hypothetical protein
MSFEEEVKQISSLIASSKEIFIIEELKKYTTYNYKGELIWCEPVKLRLQEKNDWEQRVKEAIEKIPKLCETQLEVHPLEIVLWLKKELGL